MSYFFYFGGQTPLPSVPFYFQQNLPYFPQIRYENPSYSMESQLPSFHIQNPDPSMINKSTQQLPPVISEEINRMPEQPVRFRRKREKNMERELVSAKKNSQSNIINHFFTYFTLKQCSETVVRKTIRSLNKIQADVQKIMTIIYNVIRLINIKRGRKYINKAILYSYFTEEWLLESIQNIQNLLEITLSEIALVMRKCLSLFINEISLTSILTSKRITKHSKEIHLAKRRKILSFMKYNGDNE